MSVSDQTPSSSSSSRLEPPALSLEAPAPRRFDRGVAYALWALLGFLGAHRFWWGKTGSALAQLGLLAAAIPLLTYGGARFVGRLMSDRPGEAYGFEMALCAAGFAAFVAAMAWWIADAALIRKWPPKLDRPHFWRR